MSDGDEQILTKLGVEVRVGSRVTSVTDQGVNLANGEFIPSELVVWAAGVKGPDVLAKLDGLEVSRLNTLVVKPTLQTTRDDNIFVIGDAAYLVPDGETAAVPPRAQAAHQQSTHLVRQLQRRINGETKLRPSSIATLDRWFRSANIRRSAA